MKKRISDLNGISICLGLFHAYKFWNCVYWAFIFAFLCSFLEFFFLYQVFLSNTNYFWTHLFSLSMEPLLGATSSGKSGTGSNGNKWVLHHSPYLLDKNTTRYGFASYPVYPWVSGSLVGFCLVLWYINPWRLIYAKSSLYIYIKYIWFGLVGFYGISTIVGYLMPNSSLYRYIKYVWFGLVGFYGISTIVGYLMPNPLYTDILNMYIHSNIYDLDLVWLSFMAYQTL